MNFETFPHWSDKLTLEVTVNVDGKDVTKTQVVKKADIRLYRMTPSMKIFRITHQRARELMMWLLKEDMVGSNVRFNLCTGERVGFVIGDSRSNVKPFVRWFEENKAWWEAQKDRHAGSLAKALRGIH